MNGGDEARRKPEEVNVEIIVTETKVLIPELRLSLIFLVRPNFELAARTVDCAYLAHCLECRAGSGDTAAFECMSIM